MSDFDTGVSRYIYGIGTVMNPFPVDHRGNEDVCCEQCNFYGQRGRRCNLTQELVAYPARGRGRECPLELQEQST